MVAWWWGGDDAEVERVVVALNRAGGRSDMKEAPKAVIADQDVLIARPDLGPGAQTLIRAGHAIPSGLVSNERRPAQPNTKASPRSTRRKRGGDSDE